ncbi:MAG TPA: primosomal protein N' [Methylophilus sp.]|nr:primosomal protein N' [Methylophilus sp.]HQQ32352.1 primosomal protein N' [Methylophilus sp.]
MPKILRIALDVPLDRLFDYSDNGFSARIGNRVVVSFAGRNLIGVVIDIVTHSELKLEKLKTVAHVFDDVVFDNDSFKLLKFCADYYHAPLGQVLLSSLPLRLRQTKPAATRKTYSYRLCATIDLTGIPTRQAVLRRVVQALQSSESLTEVQLVQISSTWRKAILQLEAQGLVSKQEVVAVKPSLPANHSAPLLNAEQQAAINAVLADKDKFKPWLLYGITGSGKTEVYMQILAEVLHKPNTQALVLVPEINLTPQLEARFRSRLSQYSLVTLHSNLSESERLHNWQASVSGSARIVIGTRLSVFTPMPHLSIIVMDEEHDGSYKQQEGMRYHARDVALMRAKQLGIPVLMGSATPALETWHQAQKGQYGLLTLKARAVESAQLPKIHCIDTAKSPTENGFSPLLVKAIKTRLSRGEQSLLFLNRRGYAPVLHCNACQWLSSCPRCSARLVVHLSQRRLKCHHCGHEQKIPLQCPSCGNPDLKPVGQATQRLEVTLKELFPQARIARVDRDSMRNKDALHELLSRVHAGDIDILVGTQMLAKGHDFPNLTLVGVLDTDSALYSPDFRAAERLFAQLMQVAGRAGRADKAGEVLIQTAFPQHPLFTALRHQDYASYAAELLQERQVMHFPPLRYFALIKAEANDYALVNQFLKQVAQWARQTGTEVMIYDPVRPQMERLKGMERGQLLFQSDSRGRLQQLFKQLIPKIRTDKLTVKMRWVLDLDPLDI